MAKRCHRFHFHNDRSKVSALDLTPPEGARVGMKEFQV
jgi:hypothetical protein